MVFYQYNPLTKKTAHKINSIISKGVINFIQALKLTFTIANDGKIRPVGVIKPIIPIPNK